MPCRHPQHLCILTSPCSHGHGYPAPAGTPRPTRPRRGARGTGATTPTVQLRGFVGGLLRLYREGVPRRVLASVRSTKWCVKQLAAVARCIAISRGGVVGCPGVGLQVTWQGDGARGAHTIQYSTIARGRTDRHTVLNGGRVSEGGGGGGGSGGGGGGGRRGRGRELFF
eukprot:COSAG02_NODE_7640_length_2920_cov_5.152074_5_plen_169_part_00